MPPKITIAVPFYNNRETIGRCLTSIASQGYQDYEVLLIDDGATDDCYEVATSYARFLDIDNKCRFYRQENQGIAKTRTRILSLAEGEWLYFVDADDWIEPDTLEKMTAAIKDDTQMVICEFTRVSNGRMSHKKRPFTGTVNIEDFVDEMLKHPADFYYAALWNKMLKMELIRMAGLSFDQEIKFGEDHAFVLGYLSLVEKIAAVKESLYYYNDTPGSLVHQGMNAKDICMNKFFTIEKLARLLDGMGMMTKGKEALRLSLFLISPATDWTVLFFDKKFDPKLLPEKKWR